MFDTLTRRLGSLMMNLRRQGRLTEDDVNEALKEVRTALLEADVNFTIAKEFVKRVREKAVGEEIFASLTADQTLIKIVRDELVELLGNEETPMNWASNPPTVILMCGLQGSGKTTTCAKLAKNLIRQGKKPMLAACDIQRPAAVKQLQVLGEQVGVPVFFEEGATPPQIAQRALERCRHLFLDVLIVDTAGRLSIDEPLMEELAAVTRVCPPSEKLLVVDAATGQEAVNVARAFHERVGLSGTIFSKMDGDARGGAILSVREATGVPVRYVGVGEGVDALETFFPSRVAERILGMGDVLGIIEKAEQAINVEEAQGLEEKMRSGRLDFNDFLSQMKMVRRLGPLKNVMKMVPGLAAAVPEDALENIDERKLDHIEAIILSMTPAERKNPDILNGSRRKRIARGSGRSQQEVNQAVDQLYAMRRQMKELGRMQKKFGKIRRR